jgi:hypothetical protein
MLDQIPPEDWSDTVDRIVAREIDPYTATERLIAAAGLALDRE